MKLDRTTYEAWLLDRIEGNLTPAQERELDDFLAANPDLSVDSSGLPALEGDAAEAFDGKDALKKRLPPIGLPDAARINDFLIARLEGDLDAAQTQALDKFLYEHPQFEQDAKRIGASRSDARPVPFEDKPSIERHFPPRGMPDKHRLTEFLIAAQEGDLSKEQQRSLAHYLASHPEARRDERLILASKVPAERIVFTGKEGLKKREVRVIALWQRYAVAASIALLLGFAWWVMRTENSDEPAIAGTEKHKVEVVAPPVQPAPDAQDPDATIPGAKLEESGEKSATEPKAERGHGPDARPAQDERKDVPVSSPHEERLNTPQVPAAPLEAPAPEPQLVETPTPDQEQPAPEVAQTPVPDQVIPTTGAGEETAASVGSASEGGTPIGTVLANTVRQGVLDSEERTNGLDGSDVLAMANKAIGAVTGGKGRVDVAAKGTRTGWKLRFGQNLAISASTGR